VHSSILIVVANHLWQSTLFAMALGCIVFLLRGNGARIRCCLWLAASAKFLVPFAWLNALGARIPWPYDSIRATFPELSALVGQTAAHGARISAEHAPAITQASFAVKYDGVILIALEAVWVMGALAVVARWLRRWLLVRCVLKTSVPTGLNFVIPIRSSSSQFEPAVVGILFPVLLLPVGMEHHLAPEEMDAMLAHERCHVAWRDNLAATIHMLVEALFWFHPLVWWLGRRIIDERERACDEQVLAQGHASRSYAESILKVCDYYLQSPLTCAAGVGGGNLSQRIEAIMKNRMIKGLDAGRKVVLTIAACATVAIPLGIGILTATRGRAEAATADENVPVLHNVSIQLAPASTSGEFPEGSFNALGLLLIPRACRTSGPPCPGGGERVEVAYHSLRGFIAVAYGVDGSQVVGKDLSKVPNYQITADNPWPESPTMTADERAANHRTSVKELATIQRGLLATHFGLVVKRERRQMAGYVLTIGMAGSKLRPDGSAPEWKKNTWSASNGIFATDTAINALVGTLQRMLQAPVVDQTALTATYDYEWHAPTFGDRPDPAAIAKTLEEQLGLHLEARTVTVDVINVISLNSPEQVLTSK
jgi:bla regulator protein BlaR1